MQRMRNLALISALVAAAIIVGAFALATYRREVAPEAEEHEHEFGEHNHHAPAAQEPLAHEHALPGEQPAEHGEPAARPQQPAPSAPVEEPEPQPEAESEHDHAHHDHHH